MTQKEGRAGKKMVHGRGGTVPGSTLWGEGRQLKAIAGKKEIVSSLENRKIKKSRRDWSPSVKEGREAKLVYFSNGKRKRKTKRREERKEDRNCTHQISPRTQPS